MALKAGRVGIDPKYVDEDGKPISNNEEIENEIQRIELDIAQLQTSKVGIAQLTANSKTFNFAYDATSQKYGYKLDGTGDFIPFDDPAVVGMNIPEAVTAGIIFECCDSSEVVDTSKEVSAEITSGGYQVDNGMCYIDCDMVIHSTESAYVKVSGFPKSLSTNWRYVAHSAFNDVANMSTDTYAFKPATNDDYFVIYGLNTSASDTVIRISGMYPVST